MLKLRGKKTPKVKRSENRVLRDNSRYFGAATKAILNLTSLKNVC